MSRVLKLPTLEHLPSSISPRDQNQNLILQSSTEHALPRISHTIVSFIIEYSEGDEEGYVDEDCYVDYFPEEVHV